MLTAAGLATAGLWHEPAGLVIGAAVLGVGVAVFTPALFSVAVDGVPPNERGAVMGTTSAFLDVAFGIGADEATDEALHRLDQLNRLESPVVCFDADSTCVG